MNRKRTYRLYRDEGLSIRPKLPKRKRLGDIGRVDRDRRSPKS